LILHSETLHAFLRHAESVAKDILEKECGLKTNRTRFMVHTTSWPLNLVCFEGSSRWAYYDHRFMQLGLNKRLAGRIKDSVLRDLLRHELAHYLTHIYHGDNIQAHGPEYRALCASYGWPTEVASASGDLFQQHEESVGDLASDALVEKVKKLLALATSNNPHEAELATIKANQLILRHHLSRADLHMSEEELCVLTVMTSSRKNTLMVAIYDILTHFMVKPLLHYGKSEVRLDVIGDRSQVQLAEYIAVYLQRELEALWGQSGLKGIRAKNSFFTGVARGYRLKLEASRQSYSTEEKMALVKVEKVRHERIRHLMGGFGASRSGQVMDGEALGRGTKAGMNLTIHASVKNGESKRLALPWK